MKPDFFAHPLSFLQTVYPGSFPLTPPEPESQPERLPGALLSTEESAAFLSISPETLRRLCRRKAITFIQVTPSEYRFAIPDLEEYVASRRFRRKSAVR